MKDKENKNTDEKKEAEIYQLNTDAYWNRKIIDRKSAGEGNEQK